MSMTARPLSRAPTSHLVTLHDLGADSEGMYDPRSRNSSSLSLLSVNSSATWEVDCGCCSVSISDYDSAVEGLAHIQIRIERRARGVRHRRLWAAFRRALYDERDFVITYDLRHQLNPGSMFMSNLVQFHEEQFTILARRVKAIAFLTMDSIFSLAVECPFSGLIKACPTSCPYTICHSSKAAKEFFRQCIGLKVPANQSKMAFVTVASVRANESHLQGPRSCALLSPASCRSEENIDGRPPPPDSNVDSFHGAGMEIFQQAQATNGTDGMKPVACYSLPSGDVRVMQSLPKELFEVTVPAAKRRSSSKGIAKSNESNIEAVADNSQNTSPTCVLKFGCPADALKQILFSHLHLGELLLDAEVEARLLSQMKRKDRGATRDAGFSRRRKCHWLACVAYSCGTSSWRKVRVMR